MTLVLSVLEQGMIYAYLPFIFSLHEVILVLMILHIIFINKMI